MFYGKITIWSHSITHLSVGNERLTDFIYVVLVGTWAFWFVTAGLLKSTTEPIGTGFMGQVFLISTAGPSCSVHLGFTCCAKQISWFTVQRREGVCGAAKQGNKLCENGATAPSRAEAPAAYRPSNRMGLPGKSLISCMPVHACQSMSRLQVFITQYWTNDDLALLRTFHACFAGVGSTGDRVCRGT